MNKRQKEILKRIKQKEQDRKEFLEILEYLANNPDMKYKIEKAFMSLSEALFDYLRAVKTTVDDLVEILKIAAEEMEKEKEQPKYRVKFAENVYLEKSWPDSIEDVTIEYSTIDWRIGDGKKYVLFTEEEIKSIDERYWDFRVEVN